MHGILETKQRSFMEMPLIECVPNFSEGRDLTIIKQIVDAIDAIDGVQVLNVDPGHATNRTVVTFVGESEAVVEAAFQGAKKAAELIDMRKHHGEHPRFGALDVLPLIPISGISMDETAKLARKLGKRIGDELGISVYFYEKSATNDQRRNLADVRHGEYEGLRDKLADKNWKPDAGPATLNEKSGAMAVGARDFLIAYNVNLNTTSTRRANAIAFDVREKGRLKRVENKLTGEVITDANGEPVWEPGTLKSVKAIGWFIEEYGIAQVSMNLTSMRETPVHLAFEEVCEKAAMRGIRVTGSELIGLIPLSAILEAGRYFLKKQQRSTGISDAEIIKIAVKSMGLDDLKPFNAQEKIIEYAMLRGVEQKRLVDLTVKGFVEETASESVAPGGGSVAALLGALGAALATMVANLSSHKRGWDERWEEFSDWAEKGKVFHEQLLGLIDADTDAFNALMSAFGLPKESPEEQEARRAAIQEATKNAAAVPLMVMRTALSTMEVVKAMAEIGNPNSASDAGVGAICARSAVFGAALNVQTNCSSIKDAEFVSRILKEAHEMVAIAESLERDILTTVQAKFKS
jgi:glutamate formiminotransferase/formiminotetrahydrofolate cyclodeaminase